MNIIPEMPIKKIRGLIVDNHAVVRQGLRMFIEMQNDMEVVGEGANGLEAVGVSLPTRMAFFDNLKVLMMIMVIVHHVGQAYGPICSWWPVMEPEGAEILGPFFRVNRTFGMSLFFMIAGYFTARSCEKHGPASLARNRLQRLGIPLLGFSILMIFLLVFVFGLLETGELGKVWPINVLHFWFVQHLLLSAWVIRHGDGYVATLGEGLSSW